MNILYISSKKRWGGLFSWMLKTARGLEKRGHKVWILSHPNSKFNAVASKEIRILSKKLGFEYNPFMISKLVLFIRQHNIDLVVTNIEKEIGIGGLAAKICSIPNIRRIGREDDFFQRLKTRFNHIYLVSTSIVPCDYIADTVVNQVNYVKKEELTTIYNGSNPKKIDLTDILDFKRGLGLKDKDKIIGMTCQLLRIKYVDHLIRAYFSICSKYPEWKLLITGEGPERNHLEKLVADFGISHKVIFAGYSSQPFLSASIYDIAMLTSKLEGFPNTIVEYFAVQKPVISTDVGGIREIINDRVNGFLIPFGDIGAMSERISMLIENKTLREKVSNSALETLKQKFSEDKMINTLEKYFLDQIKD